MLNNSPLYQKQDMVIRDEDYCRKNGLMSLSDKQLRAYPNAWRSWPRNYGGNYGDNSDVPLWNGLARSLNTIAVRVGDLVGASNIFNFVYNTLQLNTLDPVNDVGLAQMVMGSQTHGVTPTALAAAFQIFYAGYGRKGPAGSLITVLLAGVLVHAAQKHLVAAELQQLAVLLLVEGDNAPLGIHPHAPERGGSRILLHGKRPPLM